MQVYGLGIMNYLILFLCIYAAYTVGEIITRAVFSFLNWLNN